MGRARRIEPQELLAEAEALDRLFKERAKVSQERFGEDYDLGTQGNVSQYLKGRMPLNLEAAIKFSEGLGCDIADFSPRLAALLARGRRNDPRFERYEVPDHMLHPLLRDFQDLGRAKRLEILAYVRAAVVTDQEFEKRGIKKDYPTDHETVKHLRLSPDEVKESPPKPRNRKQLSLFGATRKRDH